MNGPVVDERILYGAAAFITAAGSMCLGSMVIDNRRFVVREYTVESEKLTDPVRIVFLTDMHEKDYGNDNASLVRVIQKLAPDLILSGGDQIVSESAANAADDDESWYARTVSLLGRLSDIAPVYMAEGNHEMRLHKPGSSRSRYRRFLERLENAGVRYLHNESAVCGSLRISGLELPGDYYRRFRKHTMDPDVIRGLLGGPDRERFQILLAHDPDYFARYAEWGADLTLSGHLHGGLMRLPLVGGVVSPAPALFPRYSGGLYERDGRKLIVSCGLGMHTLPIRIFNPGELTVIRLTPKGTDRHGNPC